ncbi:hypothetical protein HMPREF1022_02261 [Desulfovibrio sp. 6_1_46AFAA]|nr:hypothetical protein HMPREF1022_02261 [Desulfovibrio sp. 6_1_46AFAA]
MKVEEVSIRAAIIKERGMIIYLNHDRPDFWIQLGEGLGWCRFTNRSRLPHEEELIPIKGLTEEQRVEFAERASKPRNTIEETFVPVELRPAHASAPSPVIVSANVLWRKKEALECVINTMSFLEGLDQS